MSLSDDLSQNSSVMRLLCAFLGKVFYNKQAQ